MTATGIVAVFSALSAASSGAHGSFSGMLAMLTACRCVTILASQIVVNSMCTVDSFWVSVWAQNTLVDPSRLPNSLKKLRSARMPSIGGSLLQPVRVHKQFALIVF